MTKRAVLFDLDGTLLDTLADLANSMNAALASRGLLTHPTESYRHFVGDGVDMLVRRAAPQCENDAALRTLLGQAMRDEYSRRWAEHARPYDGIEQMLAAISERGLAMAILSNKPHEFTRMCVERFLPGWNFAVVQGVDDSTQPKPDPAGALAVAHALGPAPGEIVYLGDTNTDMITANAAGMFAVGALWGFRSADELLESGAAAIIEHPTDLLELL